MQKKLMETYSNQRGRGCKESNVYIPNSDHQGQGQPPVLYASMTSITPKSLDQLPVLDVSCED